MSQRPSTFSIIGSRYLDTWFDAAQIARLESELQSRGVVGLKRAVYEYVAASGLWWNVLWWEWGELNGKDVAVGWAFNVVVFGLVAALAALLLGPTGAGAVFLALHAITTNLGFKLRKGTSPS